jgi:chromosome segregation ATPase
VCLSIVSYSPFLSLFRTADALMAANARIAPLEAKLDASRKAWDVATAAKVAAEKTAKSAETKVKKAEKALVTADQKRAQRDLAVAERLDKISALLGGKHRVIYFLLLFSRAPNC